MNKSKKPVDISQITFPHAVTCGSATVKIYKVENKGRDSFTVSYSTKGKRTQKMFADFDDAETYADSAAKKIAHGELDVLELRSEDALIYVRAKNEMGPTGLALDFVAKDYAEILRLLKGRASPLEAVRDFVNRHPDNVPSKTVGEAVKEMLETKQREGASADYRKVLRLYLDQFAEAYPMQVRAVGTSHVADFLRDLKVGSADKKTERLATARTKNNARATLGAFFKFCKERGWLARSHEGIEFVPKFREKGGDIEILTVWEMTQYLTHAREEMIAFLAIGAFAGLRSAEITRLDWSEVHLADRFIEIKAGKAKTASRRIVPITDNLAAWLNGRAQESGRVMPFDNVPKQIGWLVEDVNAELKKQVKADGKDPDKAQQVKWKHNGLRHSFISYRVAGIQNANQVALEAGNSPAMIFKHYRELVRPAEAAKWFAVKPVKAKKAKAKFTSIPELRVLPAAAAA
jgi:integrase